MAKGRQVVPKCEMHGYVSQQLSVLITLHYLQCLLFNYMPNFGSLKCKNSISLFLLLFLRHRNAVCYPGSKLVIC